MHVEEEANKRAAIQWAQNRMQENFVVIDLETSGWGNGFESEIVQIGIISKHGDVLLDALVRPMREIQQKAIEVHGITSERAEWATDFQTLWPSIRQILYICDTIVSYHADFERSTLTRQLQQYTSLGNVPDIQFWHCAMKAYAQYHGEWNAHFKSWKYQKLEMACKTFGVDLSNAHSAIDDARATLELIGKMANA